MKEAPVKYGDGNWILLKCNMDKEVYDVLKLTPGFRAFRPESCIEVRVRFHPCMHKQPIVRQPYTVDCWGKQA